MNDLLRAADALVQDLSEAFDTVTLMMLLDLLTMLLRDLLVCSYVIVFLRLRQEI